MNTRSVGAGNLTGVDWTHLPYNIRYGQYLFFGRRILESLAVGAPYGHTLGTNAFHDGGYDAVDDHNIWA